MSSQLICFIWILFNGASLRPYCFCCCAQWERGLEMWFDANVKCRLKMINICTPEQIKAFFLICLFFSISLTEKLFVLVAQKFSVNLSSCLWTVHVEILSVSWWNIAVSVFLQFDFIKCLIAENFFLTTFLPRRWWLPTVLPVFNKAFGQLLTQFQQSPKMIFLLDTCQ